MWILLTLSLGLGSGCSLLSPPAPSHQVVDQTLSAACGTCQFKLAGARGCFWAVAVGDQVFPLDGPVPEDHQAHGPDGMCVQPRSAVVSGQVVHGQFQATRFELLPVDPARDGVGLAHEHSH